MRFSSHKILFETFYNWAVCTGEGNHNQTQSCKRASFASPNPARVRHNKPEPGPGLTFIFEAWFRSESRIYRVGPDMRNYGVSKDVV